MRIFIFLVVAFVPVMADAQDRLLETKLSLNFHNETVEASLKKISAAGGFVFSYNPAIMDAEKKITQEFINKSIREILDIIFEGTIEYKARGKYVILTSRPQGPSRREPAIVTGYIVDEATGKRLSDVSVYDPITLSSAITDSDGYFEIKIDKPPSDIILSVNRQNYADTIVAVPARNRLLNIGMKINTEKVTVLADSVADKMKRLWERSALVFHKNINLLNVDDTLYRVSQVSLAPFIGTNHKMSAHVINDFSLNILGGYSLGVNSAEFGGLFNFVRGNVRGAQFAGLFNRVGGEMKGSQLAGVLNHNSGKIRGAQFAGALNLNSNAVRGALVAGAANITTAEIEGTQIAGVFNIATSATSAAQVAGGFNLSSATVKGLQGAGVFNIAGGRIKGAQIAGVFNIAGSEVKGVQIAPVFNIASRVRGVQIGLINIADSVKGIPIGFFSLVWKGYHKIEISADEIFYNNLSFRTGVRHLYNIFTAGARPSTYREEQTLWTFGYGVGTAPKMSGKLFLNMDITSNQIVQGNRIEAINLLNKFYLGFDYQAFRKMSVTFGATLNGYVTKNSFDAYPPIFGDYHPDIFLDRDFGRDHNLKMWIGGKVGLRFL